MAKRKRTKGQTPIYKTLHIKLKIELHRIAQTIYDIITFIIMNVLYYLYRSCYLQNHCKEISKNNTVKLAI